MAGSVSRFDGLWRKQPLTEKKFRWRILNPGLTARNKSQCSTKAQHRNLWIKKYLGQLNFRVDKWLIEWLTIKCIHNSWACRKMELPLYACASWLRKEDTACCSGFCCSLSAAEVSRVSSTQRHFINSHGTYLWLYSIVYSGWWLGPRFVRTRTDERECFYWKPEIFAGEHMTSGMLLCIGKRCEEGGQGRSFPQMILCRVRDMHVAAYVTAVQTSSYHVCSVVRAAFRHRRKTAFWASLFIV